MDWQKKTNEWVAHDVMTPEQQADIMAFENRRKRPFRGLSLMWLGIFSFFLGIVSLVADYWGFIPDGVKLAGGGLLLIISIIGTWYFFRREHRVLVEVGLFLIFLVIGGAIGLVAQIFNIPMESGKGFLTWAVLSFVVVLFSRRELLSLLWVPLFLGGIIGYMRLELLLLFFEQTPMMTTIVLAGVLLALIYVAGMTQQPFVRAVGRWAIGLFYLVLMLGEDAQVSLWKGFWVSAGLLGVLAVYAFRSGRVRLFNMTLFFMAVRFMILYFQVFESLGTAGIWLSVTGGLLLGGSGFGLWWYGHRPVVKNQPAGKRRTLFRRQPNL